VTEHPRDPVFIHGVLQRSGTNFLFDLLLAHPDLAGARDPIYEDGFLEHSDDLFRYVDTVRSAWNPEWGEFPEDVDQQLLASIGDGLLSFLTKEPKKRLLVKNPRPDNLGRFFSLFPRGRLVLLLRDGRSVVHSAIKKFNVDLELAAQLWARGADEIAEFRDTSEGRSRSVLVRYEDLFSDLRPHLGRIFDFCDLDESSYDFERAANLPVRGSSEFTGSEHDYLHWEPVERDDTFDPLRRWESWSPEMHEEFWAIAGAQMERLGYSQDAPLERSVE
jgi:protein-tyrosine sulfotransferase